MSYEGKVLEPHEIDQWEEAWQELIDDGPNPMLAYEKTYGFDLMKKAWDFLATIRARDVRIAKLEAEVTAIISLIDAKTVEGLKIIIDGAVGGKT